MHDIPSTPPRVLNMPLLLLVALVVFFSSPDGPPSFLCAGCMYLSRAVDVAVYFCPTQRVERGGGPQTIGHDLDWLADPSGPFAYTFFWVN